MELMYNKQQLTLLWTQQQCDTRGSIVKSWARVKLESRESGTNLSNTNYRYPCGSVIGWIIDTSRFTASCCSFQMMGNQTSRSYLNEFCVIGRRQLSWDWSQLEDPGGSRNTGSSSRTDFAPVVGRSAGFWVIVCYISADRFRAYGFSPSIRLKISSWRVQLLTAVMRWYSFSTFTTTNLLLLKKYEVLRYIPAAPRDKSEFVRNFSIFLHVVVYALWKEFSSTLAIHFIPFVEGL